MPIHLRRVNHDPWADSNIQPVVFGGEQAAQRTGGPSNVPVAQAKEMAAQGKNADTIFQATGWYRAPDGKWNYTISDENAALKQGAFHQLLDSGNKPTTLRFNPQAKAGSKTFLPDVLDHPDLYKAYPNLKNTTVGIMPDTKNGVMADFSYADNHIRIGEGDPRRLTSSLLHEIQHNLQKEEGSAPGATPSSYYPSNRAPTEQEINQARKDYYRTAGEVQAYQVGEQYKRQNWSERPTAMPGFPAPAEQIVRGPEEVSGYGRPGVAYQMADKEALPTTPAPFDPWDSGRSMAPTDIAPLTDVSQGVRDYARDVVTGEVARRGLEYYNQNPMEAGLALSGGGLGIKRIGPPEGNIIRVGQPPKTYEAATGDIHAAIAPENVRGYALDIAPGAGSQVRTLNPAQNPQITMQQVTPLRGPQGERWAQWGDPLPEGTQVRRLQAENTQIRGDTRTTSIQRVPGSDWVMMPIGKRGAKGKEDQWNIMNPRLGISETIQGRAAARDRYNWRTTGGNVQYGVGGAVAGAAAAAGGEAQAGGFNTALPDPITEQDRGLFNHNMKPPGVGGRPNMPMQYSWPENQNRYDPGASIRPQRGEEDDPNGVKVYGGWGRDLGGKNYMPPTGPVDQFMYRQNIPIGPQSQAEPQGYDLQEVDHDPFTPGIQTASQVQPRQIPFTPPQAISTQSWSFGNNAPDATPTRFSDIAPPLNYYQPLSNTNGVPTYGG